jgi:hypothetical protein
LYFFQWDGAVFFYQSAKAETGLSACMQCNGKPGADATIHLGRENKTGDRNVKCEDCCIAAEMRNLL